MSPGDQEARLAKIDRGVEAGAAEAVIGPYIREAVENKLQLLIGSYRGKTLEHDEMVGAIAEISALRMLLSTIQSDQRQAERAAQEEYNAQARKDPRRP